MADSGNDRAGIGLNIREAIEFCRLGDNVGQQKPEPWATAQADLLSAAGMAIGFGLLIVAG